MHQLALLVMLQNMITLLLVLVNSHWLPVMYRVNFKIAMFAHKCIYGNAPKYLKDLIKVVEYS